MLLPGQKNADRLTAIGCLKPGRYAVTGYPKFEVIRAWGRGRRRLFDNPNPVVVYNPHFNQHLGSWARMGRAVLDFFVANPHYNLIFAPLASPCLTSPWIQRGLKYPHRHRQPGLIGHDVYARGDIYLRDVSSQVYEFLLEPRPCIFLNAHRVAWENNPHYAPWRFGQVIDDVARGLGTALTAASETHTQFLAEQLAGFAYTFHDEPRSTAAQRGADAIADFLVSGSRHVMSLSVG